MVPHRHGTRCTLEDREAIVIVGEPENRYLKEYRQKRLAASFLVENAPDGRRKSPSIEKHYCFAFILCP
jgi:hypothetical protein